MQATPTDNRFIFQTDYPKVNLLLLLFFCGYVIEWYLQLSYRIPVLGSIRFEFIYGSILLIISFVMGIRFDCPLFKFLLLYFILLVIQLPFSHDFATSWKVFSDRIVKFACLSIFIIAFVKSPRDLCFFLGAFLLACFKMGQEGFLGSVITGSLVWQNQGVMRLHGPTPIYGHPNSFAGMALGTLPFIIFLYPISRNFIRIFLATLCIFSCNIVLQSGSRTGYVAFVLFLIFLYYKSKAKIKILLYSIPLILLAIHYIPQDYKDRFTSIFSGKDKEGHSTDMRKEILRDALQISMEYPFGIGIAAFPKVRFQKFGRIQDTHNLYLEVFTNLGIQGFIVFFLYIFIMLKLLNRLKFSFGEQLRSIQTEISSGTILPYDNSIKKHLHDLKLYQNTASAVTTFLVIRLALGFFGMDLYEIYWWFSTGLTVALYNLNCFAQMKTADILSICTNQSTENQN